MFLTSTDDEFPELNASPFLNILHALLRVIGNGTDEENERVLKCSNWLITNSARLNKVMNKDERSLINVLHEYIQYHEAAPDRNMLDRQLRERPKHTGMLEILKQYDADVSTLPKCCHADLGGYLDERVRDYEQTNVIALLDETGRINTGTRIAAKGQPELTGPQDAISYFREKLQRGIFVDDEVLQGGQVSEQIDNMRKTYQANKNAFAGGSLFIPTELAEVDDLLHGGFGRSEFIGILGYTGQRKSGLATSGCARRIKTVSPRKGFIPAL